MKEKLKKIYNFSGTWTGTIVIVLFIIFFVVQAFVIPSGSMQRTLLVGDLLFAKKFSYGIPIPRLPFTNTAIFPDIFNNGHIIEGKRPKRGDIVIFLNPNDNRENFVKRCFAVGGDEVIFMENELYLHHNEGDEYIRENYDESKIISMLGKLWVKNPYMDKYPGINYDPHPRNVLVMDKMLEEKYNEYGIKIGTIGMEDIMINEFELYYNSRNIRFNAFYTKVDNDNFFMIGDNRNNSTDSRFIGAIPYKLIIGKPWFIYFSWDENRSPRWDRVGSFVSNIEKTNPKYMD